MSVFRRERMWRTAKLGVFAVVPLIKKIKSYYAYKRFKSKIVSQELLWLKTELPNGKIIGRQINLWDQYDFENQRGSTTKHRKADDFSKRTNHYVIWPTEIPHLANKSISFQFLFHNWIVLQRFFLTLKNGQQKTEPLHQVSIRAALKEHLLVYIFRKFH